jgi:hypothetical protein
VGSGNGSALSLDGGNDYVPVPHSPSLDVSGNALTLSAWLNSASIPGESVVLGKLWDSTMSWPFYQYGLELDGGRAPHCTQAAQRD